MLSAFPGGGGPMPRTLERRRRAATLLVARVRHAVQLAALTAGATLASGCMLSNVEVDECTSDASCEAAFGLGSVCADGYCSDPASCTSGIDCRIAFGGGACVAGQCRATLPSPEELGLPIDCPAARLEPADLGSTRLVGPDAPLVIGAVYAIDDEYDANQGLAAQLAVRELNAAGALNNGRKLGLVMCDNAGPGAAADDAERELGNQQALDYLAGGLGVPAIIGPFISRDALAVVNHLLNRQYATVAVSPSATSPQLSSLPDRLDTDDPYGLFWRTCSSDELQGQVLANDVVVDPQEHVAVVYVNDPYGQGLSSEFLDNRPGPPATGETDLFLFNEQDDFAALASDVAAVTPDSVLLVSAMPSITVAILTEMAGTTLVTAQLYLTDGSKSDTTLLDQSLPQGVKDMIQGARGTAAAAPSGTTYSLFRTALQSTFGLDADGVGFSANTYDAGWVLGAGLLYASVPGNGYDGRDIAQGLAMLSSGATADVGPTGWSEVKLGLTGSAGEVNIVGTSGPLDFDASTGEAPGPIEIWQVAPNLGGFETVTTVEP